MIKEALEYLTKLGVDATAFYCKESGHSFHSGKLTPLMPNRVESIGMHHLAGFVTYVNSYALEQEFKPGSRVLVKDYKTVLLLDAMDNFGRLQVMAEAKNNHPSFPFGEWIEPDELIRQARCNFSPSDDLGNLLFLASKIKVGDQSSITDDGITQSVAVSKGVSLLEKKQIPNYFNLYPWRTFREIKPIEIPYMVRVKERNGAPYFRLDELDGGMWEMTYIDLIGQYLKGSLPLGTNLKIIY